MSHVYRQPVGLEAGTEGLLTAVTALARTALTQQGAHPSSLRIAIVETDDRYEVGASIDTGPIPVPQPKERVS